MRALFFSFSLFVIAATLNAAEQAQSGEKWFSGGENRAWLANYDSTLIGRRAVSEISFEKDAGNSSTTELNLSVRDAWSITKNIAFGLQVELPIKWVNTEGTFTSGAADLESRIGCVQRILPNLRWGSALNLKFPTASNPELRDAFELRPILALSWDTTTWLDIGINAAYSITPSPGQTNAVSKLELKFPVAVSFTKDWSAALIYKPTWNYAAGSTYQKLELDVTRLCGDNRQFAVSPGIEVPLTPQKLEWKVILKASWYF